MNTISTHKNHNGILFFSTDENGETIYSFSPDFEDIWTQEDQDFHNQKSMQNTITAEQYTALVYIAQGINQAITEYNEQHDILNPIISAYVHQDEENAFFEVHHFRTHSAQEESDLYNAIDNIGKTLTTAGIPENLQHSGNDSFTASFTIAPN